MTQSYPILVVEDNPVSRKQQEMTLRKAGFEVTSVKNGLAALEIYKEKFFPILLTDWMMPEMDGLELCQAIRNDDSYGYVFIILLTARDSSHDILSGFNAGADDYLTKPPHYAELIARIKTGIRILELERSLKDAYEEIKVLSVTDSLTGAYNRGYLMANLPNEIRRTRRYDRPISVILCDIDHFKDVNDKYGHPAGDKVLKDFVLCLKETLRGNLDWVARYGGEEFVVVLPETELEGAESVAERLRRNISQREIEVQDSVLSINASFGVTGFTYIPPDYKISPEDIVNQADKYLYQAKDKGRNKVVSGPMSICNI